MKKVFLLLTCLFAASGIQHLSADHAELLKQNNPASLLILKKNGTVTDRMIPALNKYPYRATLLVGGTILASGLIGGLVAKKFYGKQEVDTNKIKELEEKIKKLNTNIQEKTKELEKNKEESKKASTELNNQIKKLNEQIGELEKTIRSQEGNLNITKEDFKKTNLEKTELKKNIEKQEKQIKEKQKEQERLKLEIAEVTEKNSKLLQSKTEVKKELETEQKNLEKVKEEIQKLQVKLDESIKDKEKIDNKLTELQKTIENLGELIKNSEETIKQTNNKLVQAEEANKSLQLQNIKNINLLNTQSKELEKNKKALLEANEEKEEIEKERKQLSKQFTNTATRNERFIKENRVLEINLFIAQNTKRLNKALQEAEKLTNNAIKNELEKFIKDYASLYETTLSAQILIDDHLQGNKKVPAIDFLKETLESIQKFRDYYETAQLLAEVASEDLNASMLENNGTISKDSEEFAKIKKLMIGDQQIARHITKYRDQYQKIYTGKEDLSILIRQWIIAGGKLWHSIDEKHTKLTKEEITQIFWFLYSQGLLQGLERTGPEEFSFVLDESVHGKKLFELLSIIAEKRDYATHFKTKDGFSNQNIQEINLWKKNSDLFLPVGMKVILFISAKYSAGDKQKQLYLFKPETSSGQLKLGTEIVKHTFSLGKAQLRKFGSGDDQPKYQKERVPQYFANLRNENDKVKQRPLFDDQGNQSFQESVDKFYGHFGDTDRRVGNEISINKNTIDSAMYYENPKEKTLSKEILEKRYKENRRRSMAAWGTYLFNKEIKWTEGYYKYSRNALYKNIVAELCEKLENRKEWLKNKEPLKLLQELNNQLPQQKTLEEKNAENNLLNNK